MKDELAERALGAVMGWDGETMADRGSQLQALAAYKWDSYEGYGPAGKFLESLVQWLWQMKPDQREAAVAFVLKELVFISAPEMLHAVQIAYPSVLRPWLVARTAARLGVPATAIRRVTTDPLFASVVRRTLILGLSDGARLDHLRRSTAELSHEQFHLAPELGAESMRKMKRSLVKDLAREVSPRFDQVVLVEDFSGSGLTLLRIDPGTGKAEGKLIRARDHLDTLRTEGLIDDPEVLLVLYVASDGALRHLRRLMLNEALDWRIEVIQRLPAQLRVVDPEIVALSQWFFDDELVDEHKRVGGGDGRTPLGFGDCALPLVLHHNAPNNSISPLWADTVGWTGSKQRRALFPRHERHQSGP